jgi:hypothetical protein
MSLNALKPSVVATGTRGAKEHNLLTAWQWMQIQLRRTAT